MAEYRETFERLLAAMQSTEEDWLRGVFVIGLKEEIRVELGLMEPRDLEHVMNLAQRIEERNWSLGGRNGPRMGKPNFIHIPSKTNGVADTHLKKTSPFGDYSPGQHISLVTRVPDGIRSSSVPVPVSFRDNSPGTKATEINQSRRGSNYRRLSAEEYQSRLEKGLCF